MGGRSSEPLGRITSDRGARAGSRARSLSGLLVHGARAVQRMAVKKTDARSTWLNDLGKRRHKNIATVAQANKTARIAWVILAKGETYRADLVRRLTPDAAVLA